MRFDTTNLPEAVAPLMKAAARRSVMAGCAVAIQMPGDPAEGGWYLNDKARAQRFHDKVLRDGGKARFISPDEWEE